MEDVPHDENVRVGEVVYEEVTRLELHAVGEPVPGHVIFEDWRQLGKVVPVAGEVGVGEHHLDQGVTLCRADVGDCGVVLPRELHGKLHVDAAANTRHRCSELLEPLRVGVELGKEGRTSTLGLVLDLAGAQGLREAVPETEQASVGHLE